MQAAPLRQARSIWMGSTTCFVHAKSNVDDFRPQNKESYSLSAGPTLGYTKRARKPFKDLAGNLRLRNGFGPKVWPNQAQHIRRGTHKPALPNGSGPISACFDDDQKLSTCEIAQPSGAYKWHPDAFDFQVAQGAQQRSTGQRFGF